MSSVVINTNDPRSSALAARRLELLTVKEFATLLQLHPRSVYRRIWQGRQPGVLHFGREIRIDVVAATAAQHTA